MFDVVLAVRNPLRTAISASVPGATPVLYLGKREGTVVVPHALIRSGNEVPARTILAEYITTVILDMWARSLSEIQLMENAVAYLDDHHAPSYGNAINPYYSVESKPVLNEAENLEHVTITFVVTYVDKRKVLVR